MGTLCLELHGRLQYLVTMSDVLVNFQNFEAEHGALKRLRTDIEGEYTSHAFKRISRKHQATQDYLKNSTPQQNGVAERNNRLIIEITRCLLTDAKLRKKFWVRSMSTAVRICNLCPTSSKEKCF